MSGRFVRASKYRHVHGEPNRKDKCYLNVNSDTKGDGDFIKGNRRFIAYESPGGGGPIAIIRRDNITKLPHSVPCINVHKQKVTDFEFNPFMDNMIATGAEDGIIKVTVFPGEGLTENIDTASASLEGHQKKIAWIHFSPTANHVLASAAYDHTVRLWDIQKQSCALNLDMHPEVIQSMVWKGDGSQLVTCCKDKKVRLFDPRQAAACAAVDGLPGGKPSRVVYLDGRDKIAQVGFNATSTRQCLLLDVRNMDRPFSVVDIDQAAGALIPYFDPDNGILYLGGKGDGNIRYFEVIDDEQGLFFLSEFRDRESHKGLTFLPKLACDVGTCEIAVCLRLMRDFIQPVSFQVPRKSDLFQEDIFPDTYAGIPALEADEWFAGENKQAPTVSMNPANRPADTNAPKVEFKAQRSVAELERELEAAYEKIRKLELEVQSLKQ